MTRPNYQSHPLPVYHIGHAGVGLLFDDRPVMQAARATLTEIGEEILSLPPRPKAIVAFSGHFEAGEVHGPGVIEVNVKRNTYIQHDFVNDFHDTKPFVYEYDWPNSDAPKLANEVWKHLRNAGIKFKRVERGVDHRVRVPFKVMFSEERPLDVPLIQVSTFHGYDLESQVRLGEAIKILAREFNVRGGSSMTNRVELDSLTLVTFSPPAVPQYAHSTNTSPKHP